MAYRFKYNSLIKPLALIGLSLYIFSCRKDNLKSLTAPETLISISKIDRSGGDRLNSVVTLHWSGTDADGFVTGFEVKVDAQPWKFTRSTDSTFRFSLDTSADTADILVSIRAMDNAGIRDESPATLKIPIKNTPPVAQFDPGKKPADTVYSVISLLWTVKDADGAETLDSIFIKANSGPWFALPRSSTFLSLIPEDPTKPGNATAKAYMGLNPQLLSKTLKGLMVNGQNRIYIQVKDNAGSLSPLDSTDLFYLKSKTSDLLLVNASAGSNKPANVYLPLIRNVYGGCDVVDFARDNNRYMPAFWNPTFTLLARLYDKIIFVGDEVKYSGKLLIEYASASLQEFLNNKGKLLFTGRFPGNMDSTSTFFEFSPVAGFYNGNGQARIPVDSFITPAPDAKGYPALQASEYVIGADPFYAKANTQPLYYAQLQRVNGFVGPNQVGVKNQGSNGKTNQVVISVELSSFNKDLSSLGNFFRQVLKQEFNW